MGFFSDLGSAISSAFSGGSSRTSRSSSSSNSASSSDSGRSSRNRSSRSANSFAESQASLRSFGTRVMDFFSNAFRSVSPERREEIDDYVGNNANKRSVIDHKGGTVVGQALIGNSSLGALTFAEQTYMSSKAVSVWEASENEEAIQEAAHEVREDRSARAAFSGALSHSAAENARQGRDVTDFQKTMVGHAVDLDASVTARSFEGVESTLGQIAGTHFTNIQQMALLNVASSQALPLQSTTSLVSAILSETTPDELNDESLRQSMARAISVSRIPGVDIRATSSQTLLANQLERALATTGGRELLVGNALGKNLFEWELPELSNFLEITTPGLERLDEGGFKLRAQEYGAAFIGYRHGQAQAVAAFGGDIIGGIASGAETIFEGAVVGLENSVLGVLIKDSYAEQQMNDLKDRGAALVDGIKSIPDMPVAFVEKYEADFELANTLEMAYQTGRADLSVLQEANRIRGRATAELGIIAAETAATVVGVGAATKAIRAGKLLDTDTLNPAAMANLSRDVARATIADVKAFVSDTSGSVPLSLGRIDEMRSANVARVDATGRVDQPGTYGARTGNNDVRWTTDSEGRIVEASATLREKFTGLTRSPEEMAAQSNAAARGIESDHGGHMIPHRFVGDQGDINLFPQNGVPEGDLKNFNGSAFKTLENELADWVDAGAEVNYNVRLSDFDENGRPNRVSVDYDVFDGNGNTVYSNDDRFNNEAGQTFERVSRADIDSRMGQ